MKDSDKAPPPVTDEAQGGSDRQRPFGHGGVGRGVRKNHQGGATGGGGGRRRLEFSGSGNYSRRQYDPRQMYYGQEGPSSTVSSGGGGDFDEGDDYFAKVARQNLSWEDQVQVPEKPPLKFEPPETDEHIKEQKFREELRDSRKLILDDNGEPIFNCQGKHGCSLVCQFCDGRQGPWANPKRNGQRIDASFLRYQESVISVFKKGSRGDLEAKMGQMEIFDSTSAPDNLEDHVLQLDEDGIPIATRRLLE